ncbi:choice-of-anchor D domain-containing protein, partial [Rhodocytophaga aerolata]|uniref:choice-of-anchor D domain-containing protein n=1 Tax=Rhodocytophaga aerolata TaxID=455078 RepID=UPI0036104E62
RVEVKDGALTINASETINGVAYNGVNTKINSLLIQPASSSGTPQLVWSMNTQSLVIEANTPETSKTFSLELSRSDNRNVQSTLAASYGSGGSGWLSFNATHNGEEPNVTFDYTAAKTLAVGTYTALLTASASGYQPATVNVQLSVVDAGSLRPYVMSSTPGNGATGVALNPTISANSLYVPTVDGYKGGVDNATITVNTVKLLKVAGQSTTQILGTAQGTGGGDAISFSPTYALEPFTSYKFVISEGVKSYAGAPFMPYEATFTTGNLPNEPAELPVAFKPEPVPGTQNKKYTSVTFGPDGKFYALRLDGTIERYTRDLSTGQLSGMQEIKTLVTKYGNRSAIGLTFDPTSTAQNLIAWVSHCSSGLVNAPEFDGNLSKLSGLNLEAEQLVLTKLPRSKKDHLVNSIAFKAGEPTMLYFNQGSNSSMGAYDESWQRNESLLAGAILRLDLNKLQGLPLPLNVQTTSNQALINAAPANSITFSDGTYNPYASNSPLTIYASGVRNSYDLVWHSNGHMYVPANGSAAGGNSPASVAGTRRPDGSFYSGPQVPATTGIQVQGDWLFRVNPLKPVGYFGHPNPLRGEYVAHRGYPDNSKYPQGTLPDVNYRGAAFNFDLNKSPNGAIEYKSNTFNGALKGWLLVCRFAGGSDIIALKPGTLVPLSGQTASSNDAQYNISSYRTGSGTNGIPGLGNLSNPLDITEDPANGNLYVVEYNWNNTAGKLAQITLLKVTAPSAPAPLIVVSPAQIFDNAVKATTSPVQTITIANTGNATLTVTGINLEGVNSDQFELSGLPAGFPEIPLSIAANSASTFGIAFKPGTVGQKTATVRVKSTGSADKLVTLRGLGTNGLGGTSEPSLQAILDLYNIPVNVGDDDKTTNIIHSSSTSQQAPLLGEEIIAPQFERAEDGPITIEPLSVFGPTGSNPVVGFGWYDAGKADSKHELFTVSNDPISNGQTVNVKYSGILSFDPGISTLGFYSRWPWFTNRHLYSEDSLNTFQGAIPHHVRVYPLKTSTGTVIPYAYIVAFEEHISGFDYQDLVVIVRNVRAINPAVAKELKFGASPLNFTVIAGETAATQKVTLSATSGSPTVSLTKSVNSDWLVLPQQTALGNLSVAINSTGLIPGTYKATVTAAATG